MLEKVGDRYSIAVETIVAANADTAWSCFMDPKQSAEFFFGISFKSDLVKGHPIVWQGEWQGQSFEDRGIILEIERPRLFRYDYVSSMAPETHYEVVYSFETVPGGTRVAIKQSNASSREAAEHSEKNWTAMLDAIKSKLER
jgi:uncharacterized protein YndB with AHSA1/START domain